MENRTRSCAVGIIAEYNPFHNGHEYHIKKAKELSGADYCIVVMSGDFVQRGAPAIFDKYTRAAMALSCGADLVIELPSIFATSSAEDFAACGISLLSRLGVVDSVCFGSECADIKRLTSIANILVKESEEYKKILRKELKDGVTFPLARNKALISLHHLREEETILQSPNNILGIEYCKAIVTQNSTLSPIAIRRVGSGYHDPLIQSDRFSSATGIRKAFKEQEGKDMDLTSLFLQIPKAAREIASHGFPLFLDDFSALLNTELLRLSMEEIPFDRYSDVSKELADRIKRLLPDFLLFEDKIDRLKTKQYTYTRISRALIHMTLGITVEEIDAGKEIGYAPYARVLGFKRDSKELLKDIKIRGEIPLITKTAGADLALSKAGASMLRRDFYCSHIYQTVLQSKYHIKNKNEFTRSVLIL